MPSNEELAQLSRDWERQLELWEQIKRYAMKTANRWLRAFPLRCDVEFDDLMSAAYIAMCEAVTSYKADRGMFTTWYGLHLKKAFAVLYGLRTKNEPLNAAVSLNAPIDENEELSMQDTIPDPESTEGFECVEDEVYRQQLHEALCEALRAIPDECSDVIRRRYFDGQTIKSIASERQTTPNEIKSREYRGLRAMQRNARLRGFNCYSGTGLSSFLNSGESVQERYLIYNELRTC